MKLKRKILYSIASIGDSGMYNLMGSFALFFLTTIAGIEPVAAGAITAAGSAWQTVCGMIVGYMSDICNSKLGRRRVFMLLSAVPVTVFGSLFFMDVDMQGTAGVSYYAIVLVLFWTAFSVFYVPYLAWGSELTRDYNERASLRGYAYFFGVMGSAIGLMLPNVMVEWFVKMGIPQAAGWQIACTVISVLAGASIFVTAVSIKEKPQKIKPEKKAKQGGMIRNYIDIMKLRTVRYILAASIFYLMAFSIFGASRMYFLTYNMELSGVVISVVMFIHTFASVVFLPLIGALNRKFDKRYTYIMCLMISAAALVLFGVTVMESFAEILIFSVAFCIGNLAYWQLMPAMIYDVSEVDQLFNHKNRGGLVMSLQAISEAVATAAGLQITGIILGASGFDGAAEVQSGSALFWTNMAFTIIPAVLIIVSVICIMKYPVTRAVYEDVVSAIRIRDGGGRIDLKPFEKLR